MRELPSLIKTGTYQHPWVGISGGKIPSSLAKSMSLSPNYKGVLVASVQSGGPADRAGLKGLIQNDNGDITSIGDIITAIDGHPVRQIDDIINYVEQYKKVGENIKLTVLRDGKTIEMTATLGDRFQHKQQPQEHHDLNYLSVWDLYQNYLRFLDFHS